MGSGRLTPPYLRPELSEASEGAGARAREELVAAQAAALAKLAKAREAAERAELAREKEVTPCPVPYPKGRAGAGAPRIAHDVRSFSPRAGRGRARAAGGGRTRAGQGAPGGAGAAG